MRKSWEISIHAEGSRFRFRFKAKLAQTRTKLSRFPILSRIYTSLFKPKEAFKLKKPKLLERSRLSHSRSKQDAISPKKTQMAKNPETKIPLNRRQGKTDKDTNDLGVLIVRSVESLSQSIEQRSGRGILIHGTSVVLFAFLLWMERLSSKARSLVVFVALAVVGLGVALRVSENVGSDQAAVWEAWRYVVSSGRVDELAQVILYRVWEFLGV